MKVGNRIGVIGDPIKPSHRDTLSKKANSWRCFSQYTDVESLLCILRNAELKANSILNVDDQRECQYLQPLIEKGEAIPYVSCFEYGGLAKKKGASESIPLWGMYSGKKYGIKIQFHVRKNSGGLTKSLIDTKRFVKGYRKNAEPIDFLQVQEENSTMRYPKVCVHIETKPIIYKDNINYTEYQLPADNLANWVTLGAVKSKDWEFQHEVRIVAAFSSTDDVADSVAVEPIEIPDFEYLLIPIRFSTLEKITITFSPWMGVETKRMLEETINRLELDCQCEFSDSKFDGTIK